MSRRRLPVHPDLEQLRHQAKDLLRAYRRGDPAAVADFTEHHHVPPDTSAAKLADAQLVLARSYEAPSWPRLVMACRLVDAIWEDDLETVLSLIKERPALLTESALIRESNWGAPMSYAANLGRDRIIEALHRLGATDHHHAMDRAVLQGRIQTAKRLYALMGSPPVDGDMLGGAAYTLSLTGTALVLELGAPVVDATGKRLAPVDTVLESDSRKPAEKHAILELYVRYGLTLPDTPVMALHRGRIDLLEQHLRRDPALLRRTFTHEEIYPPELGCHDEVNATHGTPLGGATLLHMAIDYDELEIARWLIARGMDVNVRAAVDGEGFGGHSPLFSTVVAQPNFWVHHHSLPDEAPFTRLLLAHGADVNVRVSLRKQLHPGYGEHVMQEYRDVTPLSWGERFEDPKFVSGEALRLIREAGGVP